MKRIFILIIIASLLVFPNRIKAECSDSEMIRLSNIANNINVSYTFNETTKKFTIRFTNLTKDVTIKDVFNNKKYNQNTDIIINNVSSGSYKFNMYSMCDNELIKTKYIELPYLNNYYKNEECKGIEDYKYCRKWLNKKIDPEKWLQEIKKYKKSIENDNKKEEIVKTETSFARLKKIFINFYVSYYQFLLPCIVLTIIVVIIIKNKKDRLF